MPKRTRGRPTAEIDKHVGARLRQCRVELGLSQRQVAGMIGVTYRQLYKYEQGLNRVPASSLYWIACLLGIPISYFYSGLGNRVSGQVPDHLGLLETTRHFAAIQNQKHQEAFSQLVRVLAGN